MCVCVCNVCVGVAVHRFGVYRGQTQQPPLAFVYYVSNGCGRTMNLLNGEGWLPRQKLQLTGGVIAESADRVQQEAPGWDRLFVLRVCILINRRFAAG